MESLLLYCESGRLLISADALWENGFGILFPDLTGETAPGAAVAAQRATLDAIAALAVERVIPGHGSPFTDVQGALSRAYSRLDYLAADPLRNARNAAKVALAFVLMIEGRIALADLPRRVAQMSLVTRINGQYLHIEESQLAAHLAGELERSRAARREDGWLIAV
jgi:glyoxylase-like metal-dependent hydrolase (beta-lactamase superfamily II)